MGKKHAADRDAAARFAELLDAVARAKPPELPLRLEEARRLFEVLPAEQQFAVVTQAAGRAMRRFRAAAVVLASCDPSLPIDAWLRTALSHPEAERRRFMVQIVGGRKLGHFDEEIVAAFSDPETCGFAIIAAGDLATPRCRDALAEYAQSLGNQTPPMGLLQALVKTASGQTQPFLEAAFAAPESDHYQVFAAWGLARLGHAQALTHLERALDGLEDGRPSLAARRAAQALSQLHGWSLEWAPEAPAEAKRRLALRR